MNTATVFCFEELIHGNPTLHKLKRKNRNSTFYIFHTNSNPKKKFNDILIKRDTHEISMNDHINRN